MCGDFWGFWVLFGLVFSFNIVLERGDVVKMLFLDIWVFGYWMDILLSNCFYFKSFELGG